MIYHVQRREGLIVGLYSGPQPQADGIDLCEPDPLAADHPEIVTFLNRHNRFPQADPGPLSQGGVGGGEMPAALAEFADADEDIPALKARFFKELGDLRSMAVSKHPDFDSDKARLLDILETDTAQRWMRFK